MDAAHSLHCNGAVSLSDRIDSSEKDRLEWEPQDGSVSLSGDLGWTWGAWVYTPQNEEVRVERTFSKYIFIWRKVGNEWKIAVNIWNDTPAPT